MNIVPRQTDPSTIAQALQKGLVVVIPTDTVYGIAALARNQAAVERIYAIKQRPKSPDKPLAVLMPNDMQLIESWVVIPDEHRSFIQQHWPGDYTFVLPMKPERVGTLALQGATLGIRVPNHAELLQVLATVGEPVTATSVNRSGGESLHDMADIVALFQGAESAQALGTPDLLWDWGALPDKPVSHVINLTGKKPRIIRL